MLENPTMLRNVENIETSKKIFHNMKNVEKSKDIAIIKKKS